MSDDRPADDMVAALAALRKEYDDFVTTSAARQGMRPTGTIEPYAGSVLKTGTLLCDGTQYNRADFANLWDWASNFGAVTGAPGFGSGDGTTTFTVPNYVGRVLVGAGTLGTDTYALGSGGGAARVVLATAQMPAHNHAVVVDVATHGNHGHTGSTSDDFSHGGHSSGDAAAFAGGTGHLPTFYNANPGLHHHDYGTLGASAGSHTETVTEQTRGGTTAVDLRSPYAVVNYIVWT